MKILIPFLILMSLLITEAVAQSVQDAFGPPTGITATAGDRQITLSWRHPSDIDSAEIDEYEIDVVRDPGNPTFFTYLRTTANHASAFADNPSVTRRFLTNGTKYTLRIQAKDNPPGPNNTKFGRWSTSISVTPNIPAPTGFSATLNAPTAASREVTLSWTAVPQLPADYTNRNITGYEYSQNGGSTWTPTGNTNTSKTISGLQNGISYAFRVRGLRGSEVPGLPSRTVVVRPLTDAPGTPGTLNVQRDEDTATLTWSPPSGEESVEITRYEYSDDGGSTW